MHATTAADLHWLLTSPSLVRRGTLPAGMLDGDAALGASWWSQINPALLPDITPGEPFRLGRQAEALMLAALDQLPGHTLLANQLAVREWGRSLGEYDYLLLPPEQDRLLHIELAVKVFIALPQAGEVCLVGPGLRDALALKFDRLIHHQLALSRTPAGQLALPMKLPVQPMAWLRGWMFYREAPDALPIALADEHPRGWWRHWGEPFPQTRPDSLWRTLPRTDWLAPRRAGSRAQPLPVWRNQVSEIMREHARPLMVAEYAPYAEGGQELARGMILTPGWPDPVRLAQLRTEIARIPVQA